MRIPTLLMVLFVMAYTTTPLDAAEKGKPMKVTICRTGLHSLRYASASQSNPDQPRRDVLIPAIRKVRHSG